MYRRGWTRGGPLSSPGRDLEPVLLGAGIVAYGTQLTTGPRAEVGALRSTGLVMGTALQGLGFALACFARRELPLFLVQSCLVRALG